jgi:alpha-amylase
VLLNGISIDEEVAFSSSAPGVVTVDPEGVLRAVGQGRATIRASARSQSDSLIVTVGPGLATSVSATPGSIAFDALTATQLASVQAINQFGATVSHSAPVQWQSLNESVATVSPAGVVKALGAGTTQIVGTSGTYTFEIPVVVDQVVATLEIEGQVPRVFRGERTRINAIARDRLGVAVESAQLAWSSQNEAVATVDEDGWVLGKSAGFTVISVALVSPTPSAPGSFQSYVSHLAVSAVVPITV